MRKKSQLCIDKKQGGGTTFDGFSGPHDVVTL